MNPWIKRLLVGATVIAAIGLSSIGGAALYGENKMKRNLHLPDYAIPLRDDAASIEHGQYLFRTKGCGDCHGENGAGRIFINDPETGMRVAAPNISPGPGSVVSAYSAADWERTIRHGVKPNAEPLMIMPAEEYARFSDQDLIDLVAYTRHLSPASGGPATLELPVMVRALYGLGVVQDAAEKIDHTLPPHQAMEPTRSAEYGAYLSESCKGCHGPHLSGGKIPGAPPSWPAAANLTPGDGSAITHYKTADSFKNMLHTGKRPDGSAVSPVMPFVALSQMNDLDMDALYLYFTALPPRSAGQR